MTLCELENFDGGPVLALDVLKGTSMATLLQKRESVLVVA